MIEKAFLKKMPILIYGETGVGKSFYAKKLHTNLLNREDSFIHLNLATLSESLWESELFGHIKGSFTGAIDDKKGHFELPDNHTLFLDEVGEISLTQQKKLLEVLETGLFYSVGSKKKKYLKSRLIFATNKNLKKLVEQNKFREDLFYRITAVSKKMKPFRCLSQKEKLNIIFNSINKKWSDFSLELQRYLLCSDWRGNIRELKSVINYLNLYDGRVELSDLPAQIWNEEKNLLGNFFGYAESLSQFEKEYFTANLRYHKGMVNKTALSLGISKVTLIKKMKKYGLDHEYFKRYDNYGLQ